VAFNACGGDREHSSEKRTQTQSDTTERHRGKEAQRGTHPSPTRYHPC